MTYAELAIHILKNMTDEQLDQNVTVFVKGVGEYYSLNASNPIGITEADDVLDEGHAFLEI
jgi:hypothetical protein